MIVKNMKKSSYYIDFIEIEIYNLGKNVKQISYKIKGANTVIIVTHNSLFADIADPVIRVKNGKIESVTPNENPKKIDEVKW